MDELNTQTDVNEEFSSFEDDFADMEQQRSDQELDAFISSIQAEGQTQEIVAPQEELEPPQDIVNAENLGAGRDISLGILNAPRSVARGMVEGADQMLETLGIKDAALYIEDSLDLPVFQIMNADGEFDFDMIKRKDVREQIGIEDAENLILPDAPVVDTATGNIIESLSRFFIGFKGVDRVLKGLKTFKSLDEAGEFVSATGLGKVATESVKGAIADMLVFDEQEKRLSNLIEEIPMLKNPITEYLQADAGDSFAEGKFKQGLEGLGLGGMTESLVRGVRAIKFGKKVKENTQELMNVPLEEGAGTSVQQQQFNFLGEPDKADLILTRQKTAEVQNVEGKLTKAQKQAKGVKSKDVAKNVEPESREFQINFARIEGPDDVKNVMDTMANNKELIASIKASTRGVRDKRTTLTAATDIDGFNDLLTRRKGDAFNAEQVIAARKVYYDTTEKLMEAAKRASSSEASDIDQFNFRKMVSIHHAVQKEFMGVRAEAGRALQAWSIPVGGSGAENSRAMTQLLNEFGGADTSKELAQRIVGAGNRLTTDQINQLTQKGAMARSVDAVTELWTLGLLTNPTTHIVNVSSNMLTALTLGGERAIASMSKDSPVTMREAGVYFYGLMQAQRGAFANAAKAWKSGQIGHGTGKIELPRIRATSREEFQATGFFAPLGEAMHYYGMALNKYAGGALAAGDEYSKTMLYKAQINALSMREGLSKGLKGRELKEFVAQHSSNPSDRMRADALDFAAYGTFTKDLGKSGQAFQRIIAKNPALRFVAPFVKTPVNIFKFTYERTPLGLLSRQMREDLQAGGVRGSMAKAKLGMGTSIMAIGVDMSMNGQITGAGPTDTRKRAALRRAGWQPYSVKIGDTYYSYARFEPVATVLGLSADMAELLSNYEAYDVNAQNDIDKLGTAMIAAIGNQVVGKTFMQGFAELTEVLSDPDRYANTFLQRFAGSFIPAGVAAIERANDPAMEFVFNEMDAIKARIPGLSDEVPNRLNVWGEEIETFVPGQLSGDETADRMLSMLNPVYYSKAKDEPVDRFLLQNDFDVNMPSKHQTFDGVRIDLREYPNVYARLVQLRGKDLELMKYGDMNMKNFLNALFDGDSMRSLSFFNEFKDAEEQQLFINKVVKDYNDQAKSVLMDEYPFIRQTIEEERGKQIMENMNRGSEGIQIGKNLP